MNNKNPNMQFLLTAQILDLFYNNSATYDECQNILDMVVNEIKSAQLENGDTSIVAMRHRVNTEGIQYLVDNNLL